MLLEFEIAIRDGVPLESVRSQLIDRAMQENRDRLAEIAKSFREAQIIDFALRNEPTWSPSYGIARGIQKRVCREHPQADNKVARQLLKEAWLMGTEGDSHDDRNKKRKPSATTIGGIVTGSTAGAEGVPAQVPDGKS